MGRPTKKETNDNKKIIGQSTTRFVRCAPRKVRLIADMIRNKPVWEAMEILRFTHRPSAVPHVEKALKAAVAAAQEIHPNPQSLDVGEIIINEAKMIKRMRAASMGRAVPIRKRNSHIFVALTEEA